MRRLSELITRVRRGRGGDSYGEKDGLDSDGLREEEERNTEETPIVLEGANMGESQRGDGEREGRVSLWQLNIMLDTSPEEIEATPICNLFRRIFPY